MQKDFEYKIISFSGEDNPKSILYDLGKSIEDHLNNDWQLYGYPTLVNAGDNYFVAFQTVIKSKIGLLQESIRKKMIEEMTDAAMNEIMLNGNGSMN